MKNLIQLIAANAGRQLNNRDTGDSPNKTPRNILVRNQAQPTEVRLYIYDVITPWADAYWGGVSAKMVLEALSQIEDPANTTLHVHINSPGGDVFDGRAIRTALKNYAGPTLGHIDALAASAATTVADGCDSCDIAQGAFFMIHNSWTMAYGDKQDLKKTGDLLDKIDSAIARDYQQRSGAELQQVVDWMNAETWFSADEAVTQKFCTSVVAQGKDGTADDKKNAWNLTAYQHAPKALLEQPDPAPNNAADQEAAAWSEYVNRRVALVNLNLRSH